MGKAIPHSYFCFELLQLRRNFAPTARVYFRRYRPMRRSAGKLWWFTAQLWLAFGCCFAGSPLPVLRSAHEVQVLSPPEAARGYPVHLDRAQVTFVERDSGTVFLLDTTDAIRVKVPHLNAAGLVPGDLVSIEGRSAPGDAGPLIIGAQIRKLGHADLPPEPLVSLDRLSSGAYDAHWIAVEGIIRSVVRSDGADTPDGAIRLKLAVGADEVEVSAPATDSRDPESLVDAEVRLRALAENQFNQRRLLVSTRLHMPSLNYLQVLHRPPADVFALPLISIADISLTGTGNPGHRVHTRGVITSTWGDRNFSINDAGHGMFISCEQPASVRIGDLVDVVGFPSAGEYTVFLDHATLRQIGTGAVPAPTRVTAAQALARGFDAEPIQVEGTLLQRSPGPNGILTLLLKDGDISFLVVRPDDDPVEIGADIAPGSRLRVSGIGVIHSDSGRKPRELNVLLRSGSDVVLLQSPSWWTLPHALMLVGVMTALAMAILVWNGLLRRRVHVQTRQIRTQLQESYLLREQTEAANREKTRALDDLLAMQRDLLAAQEKLQFQATHDPLTGLWNRAALLENLHREMARVQRTGLPLAVLLLDLDHFKQVNDTRGHLAGDAVLQEIGNRLIQATRPYDVAGRYGGEEFLVILPGCGREETEHTAERIRSIVGSLPFRAGETEFSLTVSIGATVAREWLGSEQALLQQADLALYQAKSEGRNRAILF